MEPIVLRYTHDYASQEKKSWMKNLQLLDMKYWPLAASTASDGDKDDFASDKDVFSSCEVVRSVTDEGGKKIEARPPRPLPFLPLEPNGFCRKKKKKGN